jgi:hypothetical protein
MSFTSLSFIVFLSACLPSIRELNAIWCVTDTQRDTERERKRERDVKTDGG